MNTEKLEKIEIRLDTIEMQLQLIGRALEPMVDKDGMPENNYCIPFIVQNGWGHEDLRAFYGAVKCPYDSPTLSSVISCVENIKKALKFDDKKVSEVVYAFRHTYPGLAKVYEQNLREDCSLPDHSYLIDMINALDPENLDREQLEKIEDELTDLATDEHEYLSQGDPSRIVYAQGKASSILDQFIPLKLNPSPQDAKDRIQRILKELKS